MSGTVSREQTHCYLHLTSPVPRAAALDLLSHPLFAAERRSTLRSGNLSIVLGITFMLLISELRGSKFALQATRGAAVKKMRERSHPFNRTARDYIDAMLGDSIP